MLELAIIGESEYESSSRSKLEWIVAQWPCPTRHWEKVGRLVLASQQVY